MITFLFIQMVHWDGNYVACATGFPSNTVISMRLPDSAFIFTAEIWPIIKALEQINDSVASKYMILTDSLSCLQAFTVYEGGTYLDWDGDTKVCVLELLLIKTLLFYEYPAILALGAMKRQTLLPSLLWICLVSNLWYQYILSIWPNGC